MTVPPPTGQREPGSVRSEKTCASGPKSGQREPEAKLSVPMRDLLWTVAQHKYGWAYVDHYKGRLQVAEALERRGLVVCNEDPTLRTIEATAAGRAEIEARWPVSPFALGTYDHQPGGWTPVEGVQGARP